MAASGEQTEVDIANTEPAEGRTPAPPMKFTWATWAAFLLLTCPLILLSKLLHMLAMDTFFISSFLAVSVDPLFLYIPLIDETKMCLRLDKGLMRIVLIMRTIIDVHYILKIFRVIRGFFKKHSKRKNIYVYLELAIDIGAVLPIPQVLILILLPKIKMRRSNKLKNIYLLIVLQYVVRLYPIYKFCTEFNQMKLGEFTELSKAELSKAEDDPDNKYKRLLHDDQKSQYQLYMDKMDIIKDQIRDNVPDHWVPCIINFIMYIIAGHVVGALWYFSSIQREVDCWELACPSQSGCQGPSLCESTTLKNVTFINDLCPINPSNASVFDFGIYADLLKSGMQKSPNLLHKLLICLSWGLRNLSSFASNLDASTYEWENVFVMTITIGGLILFIYLLGHLQATNRSERLRKKMKEIIGPKIKLMMEKEYGLKPREDMKIIKSIKSLVKPKLEKNEDLIVDTMFSILSLYPSNNSEVHEIKYSLFLNKLKKIPEFEHKGESWLKKFCEHLEPEIYTKGDQIIQQGEPLDMMFFVTHGTVVRYASNKSDSDITQHKQEEVGRWYGKEILNLRGTTSSTELSNLPIWPITLKAHKKVEIFAVKAVDLRMINISESAK